MEMSFFSEQPVGWVGAESVNRTAIGAKVSLSDKLQDSVPPLVSTAGLLDALSSLRCLPTANCSFPRATAD